MYRTITLTGAALASSLSPAQAGSENPPGEEQRPNLLLFIADDWSYPHAGAYGDETVRTPAFDYVARHGMLFSRALCAAPTSTASRASVLTGKYSHAAGSAGNLWSLFPKDMPTYTRTLDENGYSVGYSGKGWGPGRFEEGAWADNPAGHRQDDFGGFVREAQAQDKPFCFWYGSKSPHRPYHKGIGGENGIDPGELTIPGFLPDTEKTRGDLADYYYFVERLDSELEEALEVLRLAGELENTLVIVTSDNGMPFPRAKASLYDAGTLVPFAVMWGGRMRPGTVSGELVSLTDVCPTFLAAAGLPVPEDVQGENLLPLLLHDKAPDREFVNSGRERHTYIAHPGHVGYPSRSLRSGDWLLIRNFHPERYPAGDPVSPYSENEGYTDVDDSPTKSEMMELRQDEYISPYYERAFGLRPEWELYDVNEDPHQFFNLAGDPDYAEVLEELKAKMKKWQKATGDRRAKGRPTDYWDNFPYFGRSTPAPGSKAGV